MKAILIEKCGDGYVAYYLAGVPSTAFGASALRGYNSTSALKASLAEEGVPAMKMNEAISAVDQRGTTVLSFSPLPLALEEERQRI